MPWWPAPLSENRPGQSAGAAPPPGPAGFRCPRAARFSCLFPVILCLALLGLAAGCRVEPRAPREAVVAYIIDGDTLVLQGGQRVRVLGIDAPEMERNGQPAQFLAHKSKAALADLTRGKRIRLEYGRLRYDHYGRLLAYLILPDSSVANVEMVRLGLAHVYFHPPNMGHREELLAAQREALAAGRGVWQKALMQDESYYLANRSSYRFHRPSCPLAARMALVNRVRFDSLKEAYLAGFSPCRSCKP